MVLFDTKNCLKLSLANIHHVDNSYSLEKYQQDFNTALEALNLKAVDWNNLVPHQLGDFKVTLLNDSPIIFDYLDTEFCNEQCWDSEQLDIYIEDNPQNRIHFLLLAIVLLEHTQSHSYFEVDARYGTSYTGHMIELTTHENIIEAIEFCGLKSKFVDYIKSVSLSHGGSGSITLKVSVDNANQNALIDKINSIVSQTPNPYYEENMRHYFGDNYPPQEETCTFIQESMLEGDAIHKQIQYGDLNVDAKRSATLSEDDFSVKVSLDNIFISKKVVLGLAQELLPMDDAKIEINMYNKNHLIQNQAQLDQLNTKLSKSPIY